MGKKKRAYQHKVAAHFKTVAINDQTTRLGIKVSRDDLDLGLADALFTDAQLQCEICCDPNAGDDSEGQQTMDVGVFTLELIADVHGFGVKAEHFNASLQSAKSAIDIGALAQFANRRGTLSCTRIGSSLKAAEPEEE